MLNKDNAVKIAKIGKTFGLNGELTLRLYDTFPKDINFEEPMFVYLNELLVPLFISSFSKKGINKAVVIFDDIDSEYRAMEFVGSELVVFDYISEDELDEYDDELYLEELIGFKFTDSTSNRNGIITDFIDNDFNPIFVVESENQEFYIPAHDDNIDNIDIDNKLLELTLPLELFEINE